MQQNELPELKKQLPEYRQIHSQVLQDVLRRLDRAFANFFDRIERRKKGEKVKAGYPRFKPVWRYNSITYPQAGNGWKVLENGHIWLSKIGELRVFMHRKVEGAVKTTTIKRDKVGDWFVVIVAETPDVTPVQRANKTALGIDLGLKHLLITSSGEYVEAPQFYRKAEKRLKRIQREFSRKQKGSNNMVKFRVRLAKAYRKVERQRDDFLHKLSHALVTNTNDDVLVFEDLKVDGMVKNHVLAKSIYDASWGKLIQYTSYKASSAGKTIELVDPRGTTTDCSRCRAAVRKSLSVRNHLCPTCGFLIDRDQNAAINIRNRIGGGTAEYTPVEMRPLLLTKQASSLKQEAHTL